MLKLKRKINLAKAPKKHNQKNKNQIEKNNILQIWIQVWNWKQIRISQKIKQGHVKTWFQCWVVF